MTELILSIGIGKGTWQTVLKLASMKEWDKVTFIGPAFAKETLQLKENMRYITINEKQSLSSTIEQLQKEFGSLFGEVGVNLTSGNGNIHMAIICAILKAGGGIKFVNFTDKYEEL